MREAGAKRLDEVLFSPIRAMIDRVKELKDQGLDVVSLVAGEPDFPTPQTIKEATISALNADFTHYGSNRGYPPLRKAVAESLLQETGVNYDPEWEIIVTCGGAEAINNTLLTLINPGDEVILFTPAFVSYENLIRLCGGTVVQVPMRPENGFQIDLSETEKHITDRTRLMVLNNPSNPTGAVLQKDILDGLSRLACKHDLLVVADEIYSRLTYDGAAFCSMASFPGMKERTVIINGFSKTYAMTGWRLGYMAAARPVAQQLLKMHQYSTTCAPTFLQIGLANALKLQETDQAVRDMVKTFALRREALAKGLADAKGIRFVPPLGAFYFFLDVSGTGLDGETFSKRLIDEKLVGTVPGASMGENCKNFVRLSFAASLENIEKGARRITEFANAL